MYLYRFEVTLEDANVTVIVAAPDEEMAFHLAEVEVEKEYLRLPVIKELVLLEKKPVRKGNGFLIK
ncbi:DUF3906 family protein [Alkalihalobacillus sp. BA299]|uniref:DUF3906 family protein n=1 Tax=Alkalihalobacillus sp. BA299 TaxID=2815938 RepID=UPI001AD9DEFD|nr:DUF3906 family protein [Alkalihalobacillus sp. BA299]